MPTVEGKIESITVLETMCCVQVLIGSRFSRTTSSTVLLWAYPAQEDNAKNRLTHGMYLSISRDAFIHNKTVTYNHPSGSALISNVKISP